MKTKYYCEECKTVFVGNKEKVGKECLYCSGFVTKMSRKLVPVYKQVLIT